MSDDNYKLKYIKYKKKYIELKKIHDNLNNITNKIIILPNEYGILNTDKKNKFEVYELDNSSKPISYIKKEYKAKLDSGRKHSNNEPSSIKEEEYIMEKKIITPDEYFLLSDTNKSKYEINESDYDRYPNRVVPKNYKKIN
jgi:hypothetical protein